MFINNTVFREAVLVLSRIILKSLGTCRGAVSSAVGDAVLARLSTFAVVVECDEASAERFDNRAMPMSFTDRDPQDADEDDGRSDGWLLKTEIKTYKNNNFSLKN